MIINELKSKIFFKIENVKLDTLIIMIATCIVIDLILCNYASSFK